MIVRVYNKETYESDYYNEVIAVHDGKGDFVLELKDESPKLFENDTYSYAILDRRAVEK